MNELALARSLADRSPSFLSESSLSPARAGCSTPTPRESSSSAALLSEVPRPDFGGRRRSRSAINAFRDMPFVPIAHAESVRRLPLTVQLPKLLQRLSDALYRVIRSDDGA